MNLNFIQIKILIRQRVTSYVSGQLPGIPSTQTQKEIPQHTWREQQEQKQIFGYRFRIVKISHPEGKIDAQNCMDYVKYTNPDYQYDPYWVHSILPHKNGKKYLAQLLQLAVEKPRHT